MNNISPEQMRNMQNMMTPEMMKNASNMFSGMSDAQLQLYLNQMGMTGITPQMFRNMTQQMGNMSDSELNRMKNLSNQMYNNQNFNNNNNNYYNNNNNNSGYKGTLIENLNQLKNEGNNLFRNGNYDDAIKKYYEVLEEIKTSSDMAKNAFSKELDDIERASRLNIANCKLKTKDYDGVINECSIVLEKNKCFKAYFRMGIALLNKEKFEKAFRFLDNAKAIGNSEEKKACEPYINKCNEELEKERKKKKLENEEKKKNKEDKKIENKEDKKIEIKEDKKIEIKEDKKIENIEDKKIENIEEKLDEINTSSTQKFENKNKNSKIDELQKEIEKENKNKKNSNEEEDDDHPLIEESKPELHKSKTTQPYHNENYMNSSFPNSPNFNLDQNYVNQARNQLNNMSDDQINMMVNQMKSMDNQTLKNMMASQGMNLTDEQINMMKMSLTPETLKMMQNPNLNFPNYNNNNINNSNNNNNINNNEINTNRHNNSELNRNQTMNNPSMPNLPNLGNMDFQQMLDFIKKNPEIMKMISPQLSNMMGGKGDPDMMIQMFEKMLWIFNIPSRLKKFFTSFRGICFIILFIALIIGFFKR